MSGDLWSPAAVLTLVRGVEYPWHPTSVFPLEMAYFLHQCANAGIDCIIESGRLHGYSTAVLAHFGARSGCRVVSIDFEADPWTAQQCRSRLATCPPVELVVGESFRSLRRVLRGEHRRVALLIDGPKDAAAIRLSATAAAFGSVRLVAHHNVSARMLKVFADRFPGPTRPEQSELIACPEFPEFRRWEEQVTRERSRDLSQSSLALSVLPEEGPDRHYLRGATPNETLTSWALYAWWLAGAPQLWRRRRSPFNGLPSK